MPVGPPRLRADAEAAGVDLYVHAPYVINVATTNNRIRIPSRKLLQQHVDAAAVDRRQGPHRPRRPRRRRRDDPAVGFDNWRKAVEATDLKLPLLLENTAGGDNAMARYLDRIARVWDAIGSGVAGRPGRASASTPATRTPAATRSTPSSTTSSPSPAGSTSCTATTAATPSTPAPTGTPTSARARSTPTSWPGWCARPAPRWCARRPGGAEEHMADFAWLRERL